MVATIGQIIARFCRLGNRDEIFENAFRKADFFNRLIRLMKRAPEWIQQF